MARPVATSLYNFEEAKKIYDRALLEKTYKDTGYVFIKASKALQIHRSILTKLFEYYEINKIPQKDLRVRYLKELNTDDFKRSILERGACETWKRFKLSRKEFYNLCRELQIDYKKVSIDHGVQARQKGIINKYEFVINKLTCSEIQKCLDTFGYCGAIKELDSTCRDLGINSRTIIDYYIKTYYKDFKFKTNNYNNSYWNIKFKKLLDFNNISYIQEFTLENKRFDFKIADLLVEINPDRTHNLHGTNTIYGKLDFYYHQKKSLLAIDNGYKILHLYSWNSFDWGINIIKNYLAGKIPEYADKISLDCCLINKGKNYKTYVPETIQHNGYEIANAGYIEWLEK